MNFGFVVVVVDDDDASSSMCSSALNDDDEEEQEFEEDGENGEGVKLNVVDEEAVDTVDDDPGDVRSFALVVIVFASVVIGCRFSLFLFWREEVEDEEEARVVVRRR